MNEYCSLNFGVINGVTMAMLQARYALRNQEVQHMRTRFNYWKWIFHHLFRTNVPCLLKPTCGLLIEAQPTIYGMTR